MEKTHENWRLILEAAPAVTAARPVHPQSVHEWIWRRYPRPLITTGQASTRHSRA